MLGFGKGDMRIDLEKGSFGAGEKVRGNAILTLKKPQKAKQVRVILLAEQNVTRDTYNQGRPTSQSTTETVFRYEVQLDGEREYPASLYEYSFELPLPDQLPKQPGLVSSMFSGRGKIKWYVDAALDIPGGFDVSKKVQINVG